MSQNRILWISGAVLLVFMVLVAISLDSGDDAYIKQVEQERERLVTSWAKPQNDRSPIAMSQRRGLKLNHYPPDPDYRTEARLVPATGLKYPKLAGWLEFELKGETYRLLAYREPESGPKALFVPFWDKTNETETYQGGRYMNLALQDEDTVPLDFNYAYNPYCVYNPEAYTTCPLPPKENRLNIAIEAGEKRWLAKP